MTEASKAAISAARKYMGHKDPRAVAARLAEWIIGAVAEHIQKVSDIAERCADPATSDRDRYEALQELIVKDVDPVEEMFGKDSALTGFSADTIRNRIEAFGYKLVKDEG